MRPDKFTAKMQEAFNSSVDLASKRNHSEISNEHFLLALLRQLEGLARPLLETLGIQPAELEKQLESELSASRKCPWGHTAKSWGRPSQDP